MIDLLRSKNCSFPRLLYNKFTAGSPLAEGRTENHWALVNFPLVSSRAGRMDALHPLKYAPIRARKRARRERETCSHTPYLQIHVQRTHALGRWNKGLGGRQKGHVLRKFNRSVHLHARLFPIPRMLPPFEFNRRRVITITGKKFSLSLPLPLATQACPRSLVHANPFLQRTLQLILRRISLLLREY